MAKMTNRIPYDRLKAMFKTLVVESAEADDFSVEFSKKPYKDEHKVPPKVAKKQIQKKADENTSVISIKGIDRSPLVKKMYLNKKALIDEGLAVIALGTHKVKFEIEVDFPFLHLIPFNELDGKPKSINFAYRMNTSGVDTVKSTMVFPEFTRSVLDEISIKMQGRKLNNPEYKRLLKTFKIMKKNISSEPLIVVGPEKHVIDSSRLDSLERALGLKTTK